LGNQGGGLDFSDFRQKVQQLLMVELPSGKSIIKQGCTTAGENIIGRTAFMDKMGVGSELEYKKQCRLTLWL
jgi:hypothetical protein